ncbi:MULTISPECIES: hypothetical protein [Chryseobacterium]|uniref:hypothetical protein n=1 Tax=Chryseobacterium TaxID=59732 RepID=UPI001BE50E58|nr:MULTISPECIES: hypothetical protein [Chryseobacterium]MBT2623331.1 hypothetical protein [Chryseobacterium sp. ISL-6]
MIDIIEFKENLGLSEIPTELEKLIYFQNNISSFENYVDGFGVLIDDKSGLMSWSEDESFLNRLFPFAQANGSGSIYAVWNDGSNQPLNQMPIVVFGDEGGVHIVAVNILQLFYLLTYDTEIGVDFDEAYFYRDEESYGESEDLREYLKWMKGDYNFDQIEDPNLLIKVAQEKYKEIFDQWFEQYFQD